MTRQLTLISLCLGLFLAQTDTTAVNLALPSMARELSTQQWVMDAYHLAFAALLLTGGTLGDRFGRRRLFRIGLALFVAGSVLCALSPALVAGRAVQGAGAGLAIPQSLAIMSVVFRPGRERDRAMAAWSAVTGIALASGPLLGGLLVQKLAWQDIFWLNVPLGLAALALTFAVPESSAGTARGLDPAGQLLGIAFLATLTYTVIEGGVLPGVLAAVSGAAFVLVERREQAMLPLHMVRRGQVPVAAVVALCMTFGMYGMLLLAGIELQHGQGALRAGLELLPMPVAVVIGSPLTGRLVTRVGPRVPMTAGMALLAAGLGAFAVTGLRQPWLEIVFAVLGAGLALTAGPVVGVAVSTVPADRAGLAGGIANLARMFGAALGVAVLGAVLARAGLRPALGTGAAVELAGALVAAKGVQPRRPRNAEAVDTAGLDEPEPSNSTENATSPR
ncbi:MFS transporter [Amycolatopsis acididurans]|uniref:MFS transporter n=1 Tax=Amycolatopsis acididurans TaxID=2724524 RepID=UPI001B31DF0D|nr:MFS transporter [Amycolatopsis acididurans]